MGQAGRRRSAHASPGATSSTATRPARPCADPAAPAACTCSAPRSPAALPPAPDDRPRRPRPAPAQPTTRPQTRPSWVIGRPWSSPAGAPSTCQASPPPRAGQALRHQQPADRISTYRGTGAAPSADRARTPATCPRLNHQDPHRNREGDYPTSAVPAALRAMALRSSGVSFSARAQPPLRPPCRPSFTASPARSRGSPRSFSTATACRRKHGIAVGSGASSRALMRRGAVSLRAAM